MALTQTYVDPSRAGEGNVGAGTLGDPYSDLQYALNTITRDATNGDQISVKAGTAEVLTAPLTLATYGAPTSAAPLVLRGYTSAANDGGRATINGNAGGFTIIAGRPADVAFIDLRLTNVAAALSVLECGVRNIIWRCEIDGTTHASGAGISTNSGVLVAGCYIHNVTRGIQTAYGGGVCIGNYITGLIGASPYGILNNNTSYDTFSDNIVLLSHPSATGYYCNSGAIGHVLKNNIFYNSATGTGVGIFVNDNPSGAGQTVVNNIVVGWSGAGGAGIRHDGRPGVVGHNAFYNNTANEVYGLPNIADLGGNVVLSANPFVDAAHGDFSLTDAAKAALADNGWPSSYLGAHANTDPHITIGAIQQALAAGGGGFPKIASVLGRTRM